MNILKYIKIKGLYKKAFNVIKKAITKSQFSFTNLEKLKLSRTALILLTKISLKTYLKKIELDNKKVDQILNEVSLFLKIYFNSLTYFFSKINFNQYNNSKLFIKTKFEDFFEERS